ncbi:MAG: hypothetical protein AAGF53_09780 [Pseudomonadota bacterium]
MTGIFHAPHSDHSTQVDIHKREARDTVFVTAVSTGLSLDLMIDKLLQSVAEKWK